MAPDVTLIPITTFAPRGDADFMDIIRAIQWTVHNRERYNIRVLNMSLSATPRYMYWDEPLNQAVLKAWQAGITVVAAMGNDGPEWGTVGSPANNPYVISVGALTDSWTPNDRNDDYVPDFSSRGPTPAGHIKPDVVAPGGHITGLLPPDSELAMENPNYVLGTGEFVSTGSSQAAAIVSGMAALLLQANPELSNDDVKCLIISSAEPAINRDGRLAYSPFTQGAGYANVSRALTLGNTDCEQQTLDIDAAVAGDEQLIGPAERDDKGEPTLPTLKLMLSDKPSEKGLSNDRRWGVSEHLKRLDLGREPAQVIGVPVNWGRLYEEERQQLERLSNSADEHKDPSKLNNPH
jgi:subtilisin family serine protease